jgi:hypothetical protein
MTSSFLCVSVNEARFYDSLPSGANVSAPDPGFAACCNMVLCVSSKLRGQLEHVKRYYDAARACVVHAYASPNEHLVSALLLLAILARASSSSTGLGDGQAAVHAALAQRFADAVPSLSAEVRSGCGLRTGRGPAHARAYSAACAYRCFVPSEVRSG